MNAAQPPLGDADLAAVGAVLAEPARAKLLPALADSRSLPASVLAGEAGVAAPTASHHLTRLVDAGLITVTTRGRYRYRYFTLAGPHVGALIEAVARVAPAQPATSLRQGTRAHAIRYARHCYDHLAGRLGVAVADALRERGVLTGSDGSIDLDHMNGVRRPEESWIRSATPSATAGAALLRDLGIPACPGEPVRCCADWSEQRHHIAGPLGRALLDRFRQLGWITRKPNSRAVQITPAGLTQLTELGVILPENELPGRLASQ